MKKLYKLTDSCGKTWNNTLWGPGVSHSGTGEGELCGPGWIHAYEHPLLAALLNPIHGDFENPRLWEAEGAVILRDGQLKCGCKTLTTIREIPLPAITTEMRVRFAVLCAKEVYAENLAWNAWADKWLSGEDRTQEAARAARAARAGVMWPVMAAAEAAAREAARAAEAGARVMFWAADARVTWAAAARAAEAAAEAGGTDIFVIAEKACAPGLRNFEVV